MEKLVNLDEAMKRLRPFLPQFLAEHDINTAKNFKCLNPKHDDSTPSMSLKQNPENAFCHGCNSTCDIFQAAHWLEGKPITGAQFIEENVVYLAKKYGIELGFEQPSEEELYRIRTFKAYKDATELILNPKFGDYTKIDKEIARRGWKPEFAYTRVGSVNYPAFRENLKTLGYEAKFLDEIDLGRADLFNEDNMVFIIKDEHGRSVGFAARNLNWTGKESGSKYTNQRTTGVKCNIYQKSRRLYELHTAVASTPPLYIFEGYADVITAQNAGLMNCCAIGGTALTAQHLESLRDLGQRHIIMCLDGDEAGISRTRDILDNLLKNQRDMKIEIVNMPADKDPDDMIRGDGLGAFVGLRKWSAFEWRLGLYGEEIVPEDVCNVMIPLIVCEESFILQDKMADALARFTGIEKKVIAQELDRLQNEKERQKQAEKTHIVDKFVNQIRLSPDDTKSLLYECASQIEQIEEKYDENNFSLQGTLSFVENEMDTQENASGEFAGWKLSPLGLGGLGEFLNGNWKEDVFVAVGGAPNVGKSSLLCQLAYEIASNKDNDACVIYHTIDDSKEQILPRFVCQAYGNVDMTMNQVRNPKYYKKYDAENGEQIWQRRKIGYTNLINLIKEGRLVLKDVSDGASFAFGEGLIRYYKNKYKERKVVYILDNLHKAPDFDHLDTRIKFKTLSNRVKETACRYHVCIICTAEYIKLPPGTIPTNTNIAETRALIYDANLIIHLYNQLHDLGGDAVCFHEHDGERMPRIAAIVGKNKITEFKGRVFLDAFPASGLFKQVDTEIGENEMRDQINLRHNSAKSRERFTPEGAEDDE